MIYERYFVRICFANASDFASITLIIRARSFEIYLLSRDSSFRSTHFTINIRSKIFQDKAVCLVHHACVKRCEIDARSLFRIMSHALADDRKRDVLALGNARPTMAGNVHGQRYVQSCQTDNFLQRHIDAADGITVLCPFIGTGVCNYRQEVTGGRILSILGDDVFHALLPLDGELLPGLSSPVRDGSVLQVRFFQIGHINE